MNPTFCKLLADGVEMQPSQFTNPADFTGTDQTELNHTFYASDDERILSGVWECSPCREEIESYAVNEMMHVLAGSVTLTGADGRAETYTAGDTFFVPKGTRCTWEITKTLRKFYMIAE